MIYKYSNEDTRRNDKRSEFEQKSDKMADVTMSVQLMVQCQEQTTLPAVGGSKPNNNNNT